MDEELKTYNYPLWTAVKVYALPTGIRYTRATIPQVQALHE